MNLRFIKSTVALGFSFLSGDTADVKNKKIAKQFVAEKYAIEVKVLKPATKDPKF